jgi:hypothetical protein
MKKIVESYKRKLAGEEGWVLKHGAQLRIALCYPNVYSIGMANLGFQAMYEIFNNIPEVSCERGFLPDDIKSQRGSQGSGYDQSNGKGARRALPNGRASDTGAPSNLNKGEHHGSQNNSRRLSLTHGIPDHLGRSRRD